MNSVMLDTWLVVEPSTRGLMHMAKSTSDDGPVAFRAGRSTIGSIFWIRDVWVECVIETYDTWAKLPSMICSRQLSIDGENLQYNVRIQRWSNLFKWHGILLMFKFIRSIYLTQFGIEFSSYDIMIVALIITDIMTMNILMIDRERWSHDIMVWLWT